MKKWSQGARLIFLDNMNALRLWSVIEICDIRWLSNYDENIDVITCYVMDWIGFNLLMVFVSIFFQVSIS